MKTDDNIVFEYQGVVSVGPWRSYIDPLSIDVGADVPQSLDDHIIESLRQADLLRPAPRDVLHHYETPRMRVTVELLP